MNSTTKRGIVYVLTNDAMPGLIKIGITETDIEQRMRSLDTTGIPLPFRCHYAIEVSEYEKIERGLHDAFSDHRVRDNREFFKLSPERAVAILKLFDGREIKSANTMVDADGKVVEEPRFERRRGKFNFWAVKIPMGAELAFTRDKTKKCTVVGEKHVEYQGEHFSLTALAKKLLGYAATTAIQGPLYFTYKDEILTDLRERIESEANGDDIDEE